MADGPYERASRERLLGEAGVGEYKSETWIGNTGSKATDMAHSLDPPPSVKKRGLGVEVFLKLFRIDRESLSATTAQRIHAIISELECRCFDAGETILELGDPIAPNELLVFVNGAVDVRTSAKPPSPEADASTNLAESPIEQPADAHGMDGLRLRAPFFIGEERVLRGSWSTATYVASNGGCKCFVLNEEQIASLMTTGGFCIERTLHMRAFERTLAKHGLHVSILRDTVFVEHFMTFLVKHYAAENLRFLVDLMRECARSSDDVSLQSSLPPQG